MSIETAPTLTSGGRVAILNNIKKYGHAWVAGSDMKRIVQRMCDNGEVDWHAEAITNRRPNGSRTREEYFVTLRQS